MGKTPLWVPAVSDPYELSSPLQRRSSVSGTTPICKPQFVRLSSTNFCLEYSFKMQHLTDATEDRVTGAAVTWQIRSRSTYPPIEELVHDEAFFQRWHSLPVELKLQIIKHLIEGTLPAADTRAFPPFKQCRLITSTNTIITWDVISVTDRFAYPYMSAQYKLDLYSEKISTFVQGCDAGGLVLMELRKLQADHKSTIDETFAQPRVDRSLLDRSSGSFKSWKILSNQSSRLMWLLKLDDRVRCIMDHEDQQRVGKSNVTTVIESAVSELDLSNGWPRSAPWVRPCWLPDHPKHTQPVGEPLVMGGFEKVQGAAACGCEVCLMSLYKLVQQVAVGERMRAGSHGA